MVEFVNFTTNYGWISAGIALAGIVILGLLKYFKIFNGLDEQKRHYTYLSISIGLTVIGTFIYQIIAAEFEGSTFFTMTSSIYAMNQTFYNIFKVTPVNKLAATLLTKILELFGVSPEDFEDDNSNTDENSNTDDPEDETGL